MSKTTRLDYKPDLSTDNEEQAQFIIEKNSLDEEILIKEIEELKEEPTIEDTFAEKKVNDMMDPAKIEDMADLAECYTDMIAKEEAIMERVAIVNDNLSTFSPITLPDSLKEDYLTFFKKSEPLEITPNALECISKVANNNVIKDNKMAAEEGPAKFAEEKEKAIEKDWSNFFLIVLFKIFFVGIAWKILRMLCKMFNSWKMKIGPFKVHLGKWPSGLMNRTTKAVAKIGNKMLKDDDISFDTNWKTSCPPEFEVENISPKSYVNKEIITKMNGEEDEALFTALPCSRLDTITDMEMQAAKNIEKYIIADLAISEKSNETQASLCADFKKKSKVTEAKIDSGIKSSITALDTKLDKEKTIGEEIVDDIKSISSQNIKDILYGKTDSLLTTDDVSGRSKAARKYLEDLKKQGAAVDQFTKDTLKSFQGLMKAFDSMTTFTDNLLKTSAVTKGMICCFINLFIVLLLVGTDSEQIINWDLNKIDADGVKKQMDEFLRDQIDEDVLKVIKKTIKIIKFILDASLQDDSVGLSGNYLTLDQLVGQLITIIMDTALATFGPLVDDIKEEIEDIMDITAVMAKANAKLASLQKEAQQNSDNITADTISTIQNAKITEALTNCAPISAIGSIVLEKLDEYRLKFMNWFVSLKSGFNTTISLFEWDLKIRSKIKLVQSLKMMLAGIGDMLDKDINFLLNFCANKESLSDITSDQFKELFGKEDGTETEELIELPAPLFDPTIEIGLEHEDIADTVFTKGEWYEKTYWDNNNYLETFSDSILSDDDIAKKVVNPQEVKDKINILTKNKTQSIPGQDPKTIDSHEAAARMCADSSFINGYIKELLDTFKIIRG